MAPDPHAARIDEEVAEIEDRSGTRRLFLILGGLFGLVLILIVAVGVKARIQMAREASRPQTEALNLGSYIGQAANTALFANRDQLYYVENVGGAKIEDGATFARRIEYDELGHPDTLPQATRHFRLVSADSMPYIVEAVTNPLTGVTPSEYQTLPLASLRPSDYGSGGPHDWRPLEREGAKVQLTGQLSRESGSLYVTADSARVRLQGVEGLTPVDSLEVVWAVKQQAPLTVYGRVSQAGGGRRAAGAPLFVLTLNATDPPHPESEQPAAPARPAAPAAPSDSTAPRR